MRTAKEKHLEYYQRELSYLRHMGGEFAALYPKVAGRLELGADLCPDPHVERLIESFAFLTARIQQQIESELPQLSTALLSTLYPQFLSPVPSMTIAQFDPDPDQGKLTCGHLIPKNTSLIAETHQGDLCRFRTCYPVELWPLAVDWAGFESTDKYDFLDTAADVAVVLRVRLRLLSPDLDALDFDRLRFFMHGDRIQVNALYDLLYGHASRLALLSDPGGAPRWLPRDALQPVGFSSDEDVLPYPDTAHQGYRLLHEYFTFPSKYLFFDIHHLRRRPPGNAFDLLILLDRAPGKGLTVDQGTFRLGCTPIINLFNKTTDPIRVDERQCDYPLCPDKRREKTTEIHSILSVSAAVDPRDESQRIEPFFSCNHFYDEQDHQVFWQSKRQWTQRRDLPGTQVFLAFVDLTLNPRKPPAKTIFAHTLCTNRGMAEDLPAGALLTIEKEAPLARIVSLSKPSAQIDPPLSGGSLWRLVSHLSLNYLSLSNGADSLKALQEILKLYSFSEKTSANNQIAGIREMVCRPAVERIGGDAWRGFCRGTQITLTFDERFYVGSSALLLAAVLERFFALYSHINAFTKLRIQSIQREGIWKQWPPRAGEKPLL